MHSAPWHFVRTSVSVALIAVITTPQTVKAQDTQHLVSPSDLQNAAVDASQARQQNIDALNGFFSSDQAQKALESARMNPQEVRKAVAGLSDDELAQLASRTNKAQADFAAGTIGDRDLLIILVCIAALILVIVAVH